MKRSRQDDETQYQYRKWKVEQERLQTPEETDARVEKALCVKSVMKKILYPFVDVSIVRPAMFFLSFS
jgi:hypothetical protein